MYRGIIFGIAAICLFSTMAFSATIYVPDNYATIQGAIDASSNGDVVIVRPGTYVENIDFVGKAITLRSEHGVSVTTIDGNRAGRVVTFQTGEGTDSVIEGFTVANGLTAYGGGIICNGSCSPTITGNTIYNNGAYETWGAYGGGMHIDALSSPTVTDCVFSDNWSDCYFPPDEAYGGGLSVASNDATVANCTFMGNSAYYGGGLFVEWNCFPSVRNCAFFGNSASEGGGMDGGSPEDCVFTENTARCGGGGMSNGSPVDCIFNRNICDDFGGGLYRGDPINCLFIGNSADSGGGLYEGSPSNCIFFENTATGQSGQGGGIFELFSNRTVNNCTIIGNSAEDGGGMFVYEYSATTVTNTILWDNDAVTGPEIFVGYSGTPLSISYSDVEGGQSSVYVHPNCTINWGSGMIDADPLFTDPAKNDFHLTWNSPCRDAGDNSVVTEPIDFEGDPRIALGTVDMGADEYYYHLYHMGDVVPGSPIDIKVVGYPTATVLLALGSGIQDPPSSTQHGDLWLQSPFLWQGNFTVPGNGVLSLPITVPASWTPGSEHPLQALVGPWGGPWTWLTNAEVLVVE